MSTRRPQPAAHHRVAVERQRQAARRQLRRRAAPHDQVAPGLDPHLRRREGQHHDRRRHRQEGQDHLRRRGQQDHDRGDRRRRLLPDPDRRHDHRRPVDRADRDPEPRDPRRRQAAAGRRRRRTSIRARRPPLSGAEGQHQLRLGAQMPGTANDQPVKTSPTRTGRKGDIPSATPAKPAYSAPPRVRVARISDPTQADSGAVLAIAPRAGPTAP